MIRMIVGLLIVYGAVGGMDNATDSELLPLLALAVVGLTSMYYGVRKING